MKVKHLLSIALSLIFLFSCNENFEELIVEEENSIETNTFLTRTVSLEEIPQISSYLNSKSDKDLFTNKGQGDEAIFDVENIMEVVDTLSNKNYSFSFSFPDTPSNTIYNLVVGVDSLGQRSVPLILKYISDENTYEEWVEAEYDFGSFTGTIEQHKFSSYFDDSLFSKGDCETPLDAVGDPIPCRDDNVSNGGSGGGASGGSGAPDGTSTGCSYNSYWRACGGSNQYTGHGPDGCGGDGGGSYWVLDVTCPIGGSESIQKSSKGDCGDCGAGPSGGVGININLAMATRIRGLVNTMDREIRFSNEQKSFLNRPENWGLTEEFAVLNRQDSSDEAKKAFKIVIDYLQNDLHYSEINSGFTDIVNRYNEFDINTTNSPQVHIWYTLKVTELRALNPQWSDWRVMWEASKEFVHLTLDVLGLVPGVGEIADLVNGTIYFAEGDSLNGTLSLSAAIPFAGWAATGSKWAIKVTKLANGTKIALQINKKANGLLDFGRKSSDLFRKQLGLVKGDALIGHHVIPWNLNDHPIVQAAAKWKWHPHDAAINGKAVSSIRHKGSHNSYDNYVENRLDDLIQYANNPERAFQELKKLSDEIQGVIDSNPAKKINELY